LDLPTKSNKWKSRNLENRRVLLFDGDVFKKSEASERFTDRRNGFIMSFLQKIPIEELFLGLWESTPAMSMVLSLLAESSLDWVMGL
jgi:hypothetical protein